MKLFVTVLSVTTTLTSITHAMASCDYLTYEGQQFDDVVRAGHFDIDPYCDVQAGEKKNVVRYDMFNGVEGSHFYWDETYNGFGVSSAGPIAADGTVYSTDLDVLAKPRYSGLMYGTGQLTDNEFPSNTCCEGGGVYPDPSSWDYPYVAWDVKHFNEFMKMGFEGGRSIPMTYFFDGFQNIDFVTISAWTRAGSAAVCSPSGAMINGEYYDLWHTERPDDLTNFHIQILLNDTHVVDHLDIELFQDRTIPCQDGMVGCPNGSDSPDIDCVFIFLSEVEFHSCDETMCFRHH